MLSRKIICPKCGADVKLPMAWVLGVEVVFKCPECGRPFRTGFKMGALLFALSLTLALTIANLCAYVFSSYTIPFMFLLALPMWILFGFISRKWWLVRKCKADKD